MSTQPESRDDDACSLCGGAGGVFIPKDGIDNVADYYGCPVCIERERDEKVANLRAANLDCVDHFDAMREERDELLASLEEVLAYCKEHGHDWMCMAQARAVIERVGAPRIKRMEDIQTTEDCDEIVAELQRRIREVVKLAQKYHMVLTVETRSIEPFAMGNYELVSTLRPGKSLYREEE